MNTSIEIAMECGYIKDKDIFITSDEANKLEPSKVCLLCTGSQGEPLAALSRIANGNDRNITLMPDDVVIFSSSPIPGNAMSINRIINKLYLKGAKVYTNTSEYDVHTSGHAKQEELKLLLRLIRPKYFMPMHGEYKMLKMHADTAVETGIKQENIFICSNGNIVVLRDHEAYLCEHKIPTDDIYIDGNDSSGIATAVLKDRKILADNGLVAVIVSIDSRSNSILCRPNIVSRGFVFIKEGQTLLKEGEVLVFESLRKKMAQKTTFAELKNTIKDTLEPFLYSKTNRTPIVIPVILNYIDPNLEKK